MSFSAPNQGEGATRNLPQHPTNAKKVCRTQDGILRDLHECYVARLKARQIEDSSMEAEQTRRINELKEELKALG